MNVIKHVPTMGIIVCSIAIATALGCKPISQSIEVPDMPDVQTNDVKLTVLHQDNHTAIVRMESDLETCIIFERRNRDAVSIACRWKDQVR